MARGKASRERHKRTAAVRATKNLRHVVKDQCKELNNQEAVIDALETNLLDKINALKISDELKIAALKLANNLENELAKEMDRRKVSTRLRFKMSPPLLLMQLVISNSMYDYYRRH